MRKFLKELLVTLGVGFVVDLTIKQVEVLDAFLPFLPWLWLAIAAFLTLELLRNERILLRITKVRNGITKKGESRLMASYIVVALIGAFLFVAYWWGITTIFKHKRPDQLEIAESHVDKKSEDRHLTLSKQSIFVPH